MPITKLIFGGQDLIRLRFDPKLEIEEIVILNYLGIIDGPPH